MKRLVIIAGMMACFEAYAVNSYRWVYHDFDELMSLQKYPNAIRYTNQVLQYDGKAFLDLGRLLYNKYNPSVLKPQQKLIIPKIIHQIWIGSAVPTCFDAYCKTWRDMHPGWQYILWTEKELEKELFPLYNQKLYDESESMGVKSDILKWEIIYRFGG